MIIGFHPTPTALHESISNLICLFCSQLGDPFLRYVRIIAGLAPLFPKEMTVHSRSALDPSPYEKWFKLFITQCLNCDTMSTALPYSVSIGERSFTLRKLLFPLTLPPLTQLSYARGVFLPLH
jgi:hypothetical protein